MSSFPDSLVVVVTGPSWGSALHALRSAKRLGTSTMAIVVGSTDRILAVSRYCDVSISTVDAIEAKMSLLRILNASNRPTIVIPLSDSLTHLFDGIRSDVPDTVRLAIPAEGTLRNLLGKAGSCDLAARAGLDVPPFVLVSSDSDIEKALSLPMPVVLKPNSSIEFSGDCRKVEVYSESKKLEHRLDDLVRQGAHVIVQTRIVAPEDAVEFALVWQSRAGDSAVVCTGRKQRQSHRDGGVMVWGETEVIDEVARATSSFVAAAGFEGVGGAEFIWDGNRHWFIEFNPRPEAIHFLAAAAGLDLIDIEIEHLLTGEVPQKSIQQQAAAWVGSAALERLRGEPRALPMLVRDRWRFGRHKNGVRSILDWKDPRPAIALMLLFASRLARSRTTLS